MFPSQHSNELLAQIPSILQPDLPQKRHGKSKSDENFNSVSAAQFSLKKVMHREIERQRRQEMATLYASLRSLLPIEYVKGKRSISDHMHEAVSYIKHMEKRIEELRTRRDDLKNKKKKKKKMATMMMVPDCDKGCSNDAVLLQNFVTVSFCGGGIEILIRSGVEEGRGFSMSKVFDELLLRELTVIDCVSSRSEDGFLYRIQSEVVDVLTTYIDLSELQNRLVNLINNVEG